MNFKLVHCYALYITHDPHGGDCGEGECMSFETEAERDEAVNDLVSDLRKDVFTCVETFKPFHMWEVYDAHDKHIGIIVTFHKLEEGS